MIKTCLIFSLFLFANVFAYSADITGKVINSETNEEVSSIQIIISEKKLSTVTNKNGYFEFKGLNKGQYTLICNSSLFEKETVVVVLDENESKNIVVKIKSKSFQFHEVTVFGVTKKAEKLTESPSAINILIPADITKASRNGQIATALYGTTGVDILQNGASDFIVNTRGFNNGLNRRILVLQDGRDVAMPLLGAVEWNSFAVPLEDFSRIELVRGPSASLYGANAFNGVLNLTSYSPKEVIGTKVSILGGDYETIRTNVRHAGLFGDFSYKVSFGASKSLNYSTSRNADSLLEYPGLARETKILTNDDRNTRSIYGNLRLDYDIDQDSKILGEFGYSRSQNELYVFGLGRTLVNDVEKPYGRIAYNSKHLNIQANYMKRSVPDSMWLMVPSAPLLDNSDDFMIDLQNNFDLLSNLNLIWGLSYQMQRIRTSGTSIPNDVDGNFTGIYGQLQYDFNKAIKFVGSARADISNLHETQFSPRLAVVFTPFTINHQFRITAGKSFQRPNYSEYYRVTKDAPAFVTLPNGKQGPPINFANVEKAIADSIAVWSGKTAPKLNLGISSTNAKALGNQNLTVEKNLGFEFGYKGILSNSLFVTLDLYYNILNDFISNFLPGANPEYKPWSPNLPDSLKIYTDQVKDMVYKQLNARDKARLSNYNGVPTFIISNTNIGEVQQSGFDLGINYYILDNLLLGINYSYYNYEVTKTSISQPILANNSPNKVNAKLTYNYFNIFDCSINYQYSQEYKWLAGVFQGTVPQYSIINFNAGVNLTSNLNLGINIFNVLNEHHFEVFGGTYLPRYTTMKISYEF